MELLFVIIGIASIAAFAYSLTQRPQPPQIIYVQALPEAQPEEHGCLPLLVLVVAIVLIIGLTQG